MTREEAESYLKNGNRLISKRLDEVFFDPIISEFRIEFYQGNHLSGETMNFMWEYLPTFKKK